MAEEKKNETPAIYIFKWTQFENAFRLIIKETFTHQQFDSEFKNKVKIEFRKCLPNAGVTSNVEFNSKESDKIFDEFIDELWRKLGNGNAINIAYQRFLKGRLKTKAKK